MRLRLLLAAGAAAAALLWPAGPADAAGLRAGVGRADITPKTGYYLGGWTRADRVAKGQHTRLQASAMVLEKDGRKIALMSVDLFMVPAGLLKQVADANRDRGFSEENVLISASHTHSGPGGYANFKTFNTAAPSIDTVMDPLSFYRLIDPKPADPELYTFLYQRLSTALRRADQDLGSATAGWGFEQIHGLTENRSIEAHLADHGTLLEPGQGSAALDPVGVAHTIDPQVNVLRVDKLARRRTCSRVRKRRRSRKRTRGKKRAHVSRRRKRARRRCRSRQVRIPIGGWSTFADHGTVTKSSFQFYNRDHHGSAVQLFEEGVRNATKVPSNQTVVNIYGNSNEGDQSAGLHRHGPAASDYVGRVEAAAMLKAWKSAGGALSPNVTLDSRWTRVCFCGQDTPDGPVASSAMIGFPFLTGSEEERGPLYDVDHVSQEGTRSAVDTGPQGNKSGIPLSEDSVPKAVPLMAVRVGNRMIVSMPGEPTAEVGARIRASVLAATRSGGISGVIVSGLANEFIQYFTTPEEYSRQHYEGGSTLYGKNSSSLLQQELAELGRRVVAGETAQPAYPFDPTNGVLPSGPAYGQGASSGRLTDEPAQAVRRLKHAEIAWKGGPEGLDRPLDKGFVVVERRVRRRWTEATSDLGLQIMWQVDGEGNYKAKWEIPLDAPRGWYRIVINANGYRLESRKFRVLASDELTVREVGAGPGRVAVALDYPSAVRDQDLTFRPASAAGGMVHFRAGSRRFTVYRKSEETFAAPVGQASVVTARDRFHNFAKQGRRVGN